MNILVTSIVDLRKTAHNRLHQFINHLSKKHEITVLSINDHWKADQTDVSLYSDDFNDLLERIKIHYFTNKKISPIYQELLSFTSLKKVITEIGSDFDVHLNYNTLVSGYYVAKKTGLPMVYDIADDLPAMIRDSPQMPFFLRPFGGVLGSEMLKRNISLSKTVTVIAHSMMDSLKVPGEKTQLVPNGVDTGLFKKYPSKELRGKLGLDDYFVIGYVGVLREWVDFEPVFRAIKDLNDEKVKVLIVGEEGRLKEKKNLAKKYGIEDKVIFTGTIPYSEVPRYISCMDACLIPFKINAISENAVPLKLFEYMACERPVISTELGGIVETAGNRVLYANSADDYANRIKNFRNDPNLSKEMGKKGRKFVVDNYDWGKIVERLERVLIEVSE